MLTEEELILACERLIAVRRASLRQCLSLLGLHLGQPELLLYISRNPGCSQRQTADDARVTPASVAASFKRMENAGLIHRRADTADQRCNRVYITEKGKAELKRCLEALSEVNHLMLSGLSDSDRDTLRRCMDRMRLNLLEEAEKDLTKSEEWRYTDSVL